MNKDDVLLTDEEMWPICTIAYSIAHEKHMGLADSELVREACKLANPNIAKAAQLKVLDVLKKQCAKRQLSMACLLELEKLIKEVSNG